jgi:transposase
MRRGYDTLAAIVKNELRQDPTSGQLFVFCSRRRNRLKLLFWSRGGYWLCCKRLEMGTFDWPQVGTRSIEVSSEELTMLLGGLDVKQLRWRRWYDATQRKCAP